MTGTGGARLIVKNDNLKIAETFFFFFFLFSSFLFFLLLFFFFLLFIFIFIFSLSFLLFQNIEITFLKIFGDLFMLYSEKGAQLVTGDH